MARSTRTSGVIASLVGVVSIVCAACSTPADRAVSTTAQAAGVDPALSAQTTGTTQNGAAPLAFDGSRAWTYLERQVAFGPRPSGTPALDACRRFIVEELGRLGIAAREQSFDATTPVGTIRMTNVIATIPGRRSDRIVLASHYDTKRFKEFAFVGASDGASSTAALLELGRVLKARSNEFTIELLFLDGEEAVNTEWRDPDNTYGSKHYVQDARQAGTLASLKALILLDMIGDRQLNIRREAQSSRWLTDIIWESAATLNHRTSFPDDAFPIEDDHVPFLQAGVEAVDIIDLDYPQWHTAQDDLEHVSATSLQTVGDVVLHAIPGIERHLMTAATAPKP